MSEQERWLPVVDFEGIYEVSDLGRVRSLDRMRADGRAVIKGRVLKQGKDKRDYVIVDLSRGTSLTRRVHHLVLKAFVGPRPEGMHGCHNDGDKGNNIRENLRWDTRTNNEADKVRHGTSLRGERNHSAKFNDTDIERIFDLRRSGCTQRQIADWLGGSRRHISQILSGKTWTHLGHKPLDGKKLGRPSKKLDITREAA
jgi:hypothetical protein